MIETHQPDIICATETHLDKLIANSEILPTEFCENVYRKDRNIQGGGVLNAIRQNILASEELSLNANCEIIWVKIQNENNAPLFISSYYRPPNSDLNAACEFQNSVQKLTCKSCLPSILLTGDFNLPDMSWKQGVTSPSPQYGNELKQLRIVTELNV